ncbi:MAG: PilZ domain-containing protein [Myxococcaceae bacterium]|nr:PilZ domain-containing protein [Myxococcaceae bacterium]
MSPPPQAGNDPRQPVRLKVSYRSAESLLAEFTRSIGKGGVTIESRKTVPLGTRFIFELYAQGVEEPVEVQGEVLQVTRGVQGKYLLHIRYDPSGKRDGLDRLIQQIFEAHRYETVRKHPRVPLNLRGTEETPYSPQYVVRDISMGGVGVEVEADRLPPQVKPGQPFLLEIWLSLGTLALYGEIAWAYQPPAERAKLLNPAFGISFGKLRPDTLERLEKIIHLKALPPPPWRARLSFGMDAVSRMP